MPTGCLPAHSSADQTTGPTEAFLRRTSPLKRRRQPSDCPVSRPLGNRPRTAGFHSGQNVGSCFLMGGKGDSRYPAMTFPGRGWCRVPILRLRLARIVISSRPSSLLNGAVWEGLRKFSPGGIEKLTVWEDPFGTMSDPPLMKSGPKPVVAPRPLLPTARKLLI